MIALSKDSDTSSDGQHHQQKQGVEPAVPISERQRQPR